MNISTSPRLYSLFESIVVGLFVLLEVPAATGMTDGILDQAYSASAPLGGYPVSRTVTLGQTFTVGVTGILSRIDLQLSRTSTPPTVPLTVELLTTNLDGSPATGPTNILASITLDPLLIRHDPLTTLFTEIELEDQSFAVTSGQMLAIVLSANTVSPGNRFFWTSTAQNSNSVYEPGTAYYFHHLFDIGLEPRSLEDRGFRTFVRPIPEPSTFILAVIAGVFLAQQRRWLSNCK